MVYRVARAEDSPPRQLRESKQTRSGRHKESRPYHTVAALPVQHQLGRSDETRMSTAAQRTLPATRRTRKSIGAHTDIPKTLDKENATMDGGSSLAASRKKSRSKSLGPGGLDALKQGHGNRRAV